MRTTGIAAFAGCWLCCVSALAANKDGSLSKPEITELAHNVFDKSDTDSNKTLNASEFRDASALIKVQIESIARRALGDKGLTFKDIVPPADAPDMTPADGSEMSRDNFEQYVQSLFRTADVNIRKRLAKATDDKKIAVDRQRTADQTELDRLRLERERERLRAERLAVERASAERLAADRLRREREHREAASRTKADKEHAEKARADRERAAKDAKEKADKKN